MNNNQQDILIAIYGILQIDLKKDKLLTATGAPLNTKGDTEPIQDAKSLYKWLAEQLITVPETTINNRKGRFNDIVRGLNQEYLLNMYLMAIFMLENYLDTYGTTAQRIVLMPKINRSVKHMRAGIIKEQDDGIRIVKDSKIGASNVSRRFTGKIELTKEMRKYRANKWKKETA